MDINFKCRHCEQDLSVDAAGAGSEIQCPACGETIMIPSATPGSLTPHIINPMATSAADKLPTQCAAVRKCVGCRNPKQVPRKLLFWFFT